VKRCAGLAAGLVDGVAHFLKIEFGDDVETGHGQMVDRPRSECVTVAQL